MEKTSRHYLNQVTKTYQYHEHETHQKEHSITLHYSCQTGQHNLPLGGGGWDSTCQWSLGSWSRERATGTMCSWPWNSNIYSLLLATGPWSQNPHHSLGLFSWNKLVTLVTVLKALTLLQALLCPAVTGRWRAERVWEHEEMQTHNDRVQTQWQLGRLSPSCTVCPPPPPTLLLKTNRD